jgi:hypothetical protein
LTGRRNRDSGKRIIRGVKLFIESYAHDRRYADTLTD